MRILGVTVVLGIGVFAGAWYFSPFPVDRLNRWTVSPVVMDREGNVLLRVVGDDQQWRFPVTLDRISPWLRDATVAVEDERFYSHPGVDPAAVARAIGQDIAGWRTVSGASTLTMQVCRMMDERPRTWRSKGIEAFRALQLERLRSKSEILDLYLNVAPYGGNLRGAEAAARAYFNKSAADLSLGEAAMLAGLPQSPSRYRPDRNLAMAKARRKHVLDRMVACRLVTSEQAALADIEACVIRGGGLSPAAPHAAWLAVQRRPQGGRTTLWPALQADVSRLVRRHRATLPAGSQVAAAVIDIQSSEIVAMVGAADERSPSDGQVNGVIARRSPGSALKPFVYAAAFEAGVLNGQSTVYDVPIERAGWKPNNFDEGFAGPLPAGEALRRSLNVPAILVAEGTGLARCVGLVEAAGVRLPADAQTRGGLSVVVGSIEVTLLDLVNGYATLGRGGIRCTPRLFGDEPQGGVRVMSREVCLTVDDILSSQRRRPAGMEARLEGNVPWFMWKTGTSSGWRDAWAVGHNGRYAIGVWVGRFSGAGAPDFVGVRVAEPLLAELFDLASVRRLDGPAAPPDLVVRFPLRPPAEMAGPLRILSPSNGSSFLAVGEGGVVHPRANRQDLTWFLNGKVLNSSSSPDRLVLGVGGYQLRCVGQDGESASVAFTVQPTPVGGPS